MGQPATMLGVAVRLCSMTGPNVVSNPNTPNSRCSDPRGRSNHAMLERRSDTTARPIQCGTVGADVRAERVARMVGTRAIVAVTAPPASIQIWVSR